jgi:urease accessory protein
MRSLRKPVPARQGRRQTQPSFPRKRESSVDERQSGPNVRGLDSRLRGNDGLVGVDSRVRGNDEGGAMPASALLSLIWLASPALPVGGFSYSEGLEAAVDRAGITTEAAAADWLSDQLHISLARADMAALAGAVKAWRRGDLARVRELNEWVLQTRETSELRLQTEQMGRSFAEWLRNQPGGSAQVSELRALNPTYPIAFALAAALTQASVRDGLLSFCFGWAENMMQAALKAVPLGQSAGQRILARLALEIPLAADRAMSLMDSERQAFSPMLAILSAQHETQYSRIFRS